jgi:shikimate kinase
LRTESIFPPGGGAKDITIKNDPSEDKSMAKICVAESYKHMEIEEPEGWQLKISSDIPISRGLKSSSSACNAIISSVLESERFDMDTVEKIRLGVKCARLAKVTVTGAFDDACGCELGGLVITDNIDDEILYVGAIGDYDVLIHAPQQKIKKTSLPLEKLKSISSQIEPLVYEAKTNPFKVMTENGRLIAEVSGIDNTVADIAMANGALGAGVSGSGPAVAIVLRPGDSQDFIRRSGLIGLISTKTRRPR